MDALQRCERKLTATARLAGIGYWEDDVAGNRLSWSEETCHVFGLPPDERARPWDEFMQLVHPDDRPLLEEVRGRVLGGEPGYRVAFRAMLPDGELRYVEAIGEPIEGPYGRIIRVVGAIQVVMDRKAAEGSCAAARSGCRSKCSIGSRGTCRPSGNSPAVSRTISTIS
jgi:PAS domain S-box-containing protein